MNSTVRRLGIIGVLLSVTACSSSTTPATNNGPNPSSTTITVTTSQGSRISGIEVELSTGISSGQPTGVITSEPTDSFGEVTFTNLPSSVQLCTFAATSVGGNFYKTSHCAKPFPTNYTLKFSSRMSAQLFGKRSY
jgi:hypothetical protein